MDLLTVGEAFDDFIFARLPRLPKPGEELRVPKFTRTVGGGAVITAVAAARLGLSVGMITATSEEAARILTAERITVTNLKRSGESGAITVALSTPHERSFVTFDGVNRHLERRALSRMRAKTAVRHVHFALSSLACAKWAPLVSVLRRRGVTTSWDFGWNDILPRDRGFSTLARAVDLLFMNEAESRLYARVRSRAAAERRWRTLRGTTVIKTGRHGAVLLTAGGTLRQPAARARVVDTTGAGDAFNGGFLAALVRGAGLADALRLGAYVGSRSTEALGGIAALPLRRDLPQWARRCLEGA